MKQTIAKEATEVARDYVTLFLAGMGVTLAPYQYLGGLLLALAAASVMARHRNDPVKIWLTVLTAFLFSTLVAIAWPDEGWFGVPTQLAMAISGFGSKWGVNIIAKFFDRVEFRTDNISDRIIDKIVPEDKDKDDG